MAKFTRIEVALKMYETGIVPVFYHPEINTCKSVLEACFEGGVRVFEFTNRGDGAYDVFKELISHSRKKLPELMLGVGSVIDAGTTSLYLQAGADFIVSPILNPEMARVCNRRKVGWSPGCGTLSEISAAEELGAEVVKIFPGGSVGGPGFVKAVRGPNPWTSIMPTGGVSPTRENLTEWFEAGVHCVGMGSKLITKDLLANKDFGTLSQRVKEAVDLVREIRSS